MRAARWDPVWEAGGLWRVVLRSRIGTGDTAVPGVFADPCTMTLYNTDGEVLVTVPGVLGDEDREVVFARTSTQTSSPAIEPGQYIHQITVTDPEREDLRIYARGYVIVTTREPVS